jgi:protein-S-isoprenylcysteine O-methyltransferase Ste14
MNRLILTIIGTLLFSTILSLFEFKFSDRTIDALYNVLGIIFSIGMGLLITFRLDGIKNLSYIKDIRNNIKYIQNIFISYFAASTVSYILYQKAPSNEVIPYINTTVLANLFTMCLITFSMVYFVINFLDIQKLSEDIFDRINKEQQK